MGNNYYLDYNQIFKCEDNYKNNMCFIMIALLFSANICVLIGFIALKSCFRRYEDLNAWNKDDEDQMKKDNSIFGYNRYSFFGLEDINHISPHLYIGDTNFDRDKIDHLEEDNKKNNVIEGDVVLPKRNYSVEENNMNNQNAGKDNIISINQRVGVNSKNEFKQARVGQNHDSIHVRKIPENMKLRNRFYNLYHFVVFRNIYSSFVLLNSPFNPKYKTISKLIFFIYLEMLAVLLLFVFGPFDLINRVI